MTSISKYVSSIASTDPLPPGGILVLCALKEEEWMARRSLPLLFPGLRFSLSEKVAFQVDGLQPPVVVYLKKFTGMGNLWAGFETLELIDLHRPRCVILTGLSGSLVKDELMRGDVGIPRSLVYGSLAKVYLSKGDADNEISIQLKSVKEFNLDGEGLLDRAMEFASKPDWAQIAARCFRNLKKEYEKVFPDDDGKPIIQTKFDRSNPKAVNSILASGDFIISHPDFAKSLIDVYRSKLANDRTKEPAKVNQAEMEGFGVAAACERRKIPVLILKGISDYAEGKTQDGRLASLSSASVLTWLLCSDNHFIDGIRQLRTPDIANHFDCKWPRRLKEPAVCRHYASSINTRPRGGIRTCNMHYVQSLDHLELRTCRTFGDVSPDVYSDEICAAIKRENTRITLVFPFAIGSMVTFFSATQKPEVKLGLNMLQMNPLSPEAAYSAGKKIREVHRHFLETDEECAKLIAKGTTPRDLANKIVRIFLLPEPKSLLSDKQAPIYVGLQGICTPALVALSTSLQADYADEEATYVQIAGKITDTSNKEDVISCYKYLTSSRLLLLLGRCVGEESGKHFRTFSLIDRIKSDLKFSFPRINKDGVAKNEVFAAFPVQKLLQETGRDIENVFPGFENHNAEERENIRQYFEEYRSLALKEEDFPTYRKP